MTDSDVLNTSSNMSVCLDGSVLSMILFEFLSTFASCTIALMNRVLFIFFIVFFTVPLIVFFLVLVLVFFVSLVGGSTARYFPVREHIRNISRDASRDVSRDRILFLDCVVFRA